MNRQLLKWMLMAAVVMGLSFSITSCKDDDDDNNKSEEQKKEEAEELQSTFWDVVGQLVPADAYTDDFANATFEPAYGIADATNTNVRIVNTNDMETAAYRFASLIGVNGIDKNTSTYRWEHDQIGYMTYTKTDNGQSWAEVEVNIKQIPHLQKIIYRSPEQAGQNGSFEGTAYYRFGDVVERKYNDKNDGNKEKSEYWICVRPAFGPAGKEDSHWVSISRPPKANIYEWTSETGVHFGLPKGISKNEEQMQNFAELLFAITHSEEWGNNLTEKAVKPKMWHDFIIDKRYPYNNKYFFMRVRHKWEENKLFTKLFGYEDAPTKRKTASQLLADELVGDANFKGGLHLLYKGYSWISGWEPTLYGISFTNGEGKEANMHKIEYKTYKKSVQTANSRNLNLADEQYNSEPYFAFSTYFGDNYRHYVIRHATGKDLSGNLFFNPSVYESLSKDNPNITDVYTYNKAYNIIPGRDTALENAKESDVPKDNDNEKDPNYVDKAMIGLGTYMPGDVVKDDEGSRWFCVTGSPHAEIYPQIEDKRAMFISFDNIEIEDNVATNIIKEEELNDVFIRLAWLYSNFTSSSNAIGGQNKTYKISSNQLGNIGEHIKEHTSVELNKIVVWRDSVWRFKNYNEQKWYDSKSINYFFNIAYNDGSKRQAIARVVNDITQAGDNREACKGKDGKIEFWRYCIYKHYEVYDRERMQGPSENLASVGMTEWQSPWAISADKMYLDDVTNTTMVNKYAAADKWVRLPYVMAGVKSDQGEPRTKVEATASPKDYLWKNGSFVTDKTSIFNEPVLFMRVMWVEDNNNNVPNLVSTDGRKLTIVHMQNDDNLYKSLTQCVWVQTVYNNCYPLESCAYFLDNKSYDMWPGWPSPF